MLRFLLHALFWPILLLPTALVFALSALSRRKRVLKVSLDGAHPLRPKEESLFSSSSPGLCRQDLNLRLAEAVEDGRISTILFRVGALSGGLAEQDSLRQLIAAASVRGPTVAFVPSPDLASLWVASAARRVVVPPEVPALLRGVSAELTFLGEALQQRGVDVEVTAAGEFKSAGEPLVRAAPSEANLTALNSLLDDLYAQRLSAWAETRRIPEEKLRATIDQGLLLAPDLLAAGLVDEAIREEALLDSLGLGEEGKAVGVELTDYARRPRPWPSLPKRRPRLALIELHGMIKDGTEEDREGATVAALKASLELARARRVRGVLLHIDSRGGSATASERMWHLVRDFSKERPIVAYLAEAAASGGYYVASACHEIISAPACLTGSIGVVAMRPQVSRLLHRLGIHRFRLDRGAAASMFSPSRGFTAPERAAMRRMVDHFYRLFIGRVAEGRGLSAEAVEAVAAGRVYSGRQGLSHRLVDALGDEFLALERLASRAGLPHAKRLLPLAPKRGLLARLKPRLRLGATAETLLEPATEALALADAPIQAYCPVKLR